MKGLILKYCAAMMMLVTAVPAGCFPTATALFGSELAQIYEKPPTPAPLWAWAIVVAGALGVLVTNVLAINAFFWLLRQIRSLDRDAQWFGLRRVAAFALVSSSFILGIGCGVGFWLATK